MRLPFVAILALLFTVACGGNPTVGGDGDPGTKGNDGGAPMNGPGDDGPDIDVPGSGGGDNEEDPMAVCGNHQLEMGELCDDGNTADDDGCAADCRSQDEEFDCSAVGEPCVDLVVCGDGQLQGDEQCDDGNTADDDGCAGDCSVVEAGFVCPRPGKECIGLSECGNGVRERGEQCDDKNTAANDGCSETCQLEDGYFCAPGVACKPLKCGDGVRTPEEQCDDGQLPPVAGDGCSVTCQVEPGFHCGSSGCAPICGDGLKRGGEECDDTNRTSGDGCSAACKVEPFTKCTGEPSMCSSTIECPNNVVEPGEICDPPGTDGCLPGCKSFAPDVGPKAVCGNGVIEAGEQCDKPGTGCSAGCLVEDGYSCPRPNTCFALPKCGDGVLNESIGEECDDGNTNGADGCASCAVVPPYTCYGIQPSVCIKEVCGDGVRTPTEECDDGANGAGCTSCKLDAGWVCPVEGQKCVERCGDGLKVGSEECDDKNIVNDDGCNAACRIEPAFTCPDVGKPCVPAACGNSKIEAGEGCDSGDTIGGDGCGPTCQKEPTINVGPNPSVSLEGCGDGLITSGEVCDDGNKLGGDGCSADCKKVEPEYTCSNFVKLPTTVELKVTYRDFKKRVSSGGHPDFERDPYGAAQEIPGPVCKRTSTECTVAAGTVCPAGSCSHLDVDGKPAFHQANGTGTVSSPSLFGLWYRDTNTTVTGDNGTVGIFPIVSSLVLDQVGATTSDVYQFDSKGDTFYPLNDKGFGNDGNGSRNYHFTTELRYFFQYKGGETLTFTGDDDVWVYVNGRLAVDIGGVHGARNGRVILGDDGGGTATDSNCSVHGGTLNTCALEADEVSSNDDVRFGLTKGGVYEIVLFHAERHTSISNFKLTLAGFLAPRTYCKPKCGDGKVVAGEVCDDGAGNADGVSGKCNTTCTARAFCGDGTTQTGEVCDNGKNLDLYWDGVTANKCAPGCKAPSKCGDGKVEPNFEACDNGAGNADNSYGPGSCTKACALGGYCGDGTKNGSETCDTGASNGTTYGPDSCGYDCKPGPFCGDKVRNGAEECDGTANCNLNCKLDPYCGDAVVSTGEECDNGQFASDDYGGCTVTCEWGPRCGDGMLPTPNNGLEECDLGDAQNDGSYDGCTPECTDGPHCGDGVVQADHSEDCDNGFNEDDYAYTADACGPGCKAVPYCGDGTVQAGELCDNGAKNDDNAYDGCTSRCDWGPYCGDGHKDPGENCDKGAGNKAYSSKGEGCGYDCQPAPYCGDGERNGPEECDLGSDENDGSYGGCTEECRRSPYCGDKEVQSDQGEECDAGPVGNLTCTAMCKRRGIK
jgi:fibro-slime domain-containing protein